MWKDAEGPLLAFSVENSLAEFSTATGASVDLVDRPRIDHRCPVDGPEDHDEVVARRVFRQRRPD